MKIEGKAKKVTVYIGETDKWRHKPLYAAILEVLRHENCAGATAIRGFSGFGASSRIHTANLVALSADLPIVIEWVDHPERVERVIPIIKEMVDEGLIMVQDVEVITYCHRKIPDLQAHLPLGK